MTATTATSREAFPSPLATCRLSLCADARATPYCDWRARDRPRPRANRDISATLTGTIPNTIGNLSNLLSLCVVHAVRPICYIHLFFTACVRAPAHLRCCSSIICSSGSSVSGSIPDSLYNLNSVTLMCAAQHMLSTAAACPLRGCRLRAPKKSPRQQTHTCRAHTQEAVWLWAERQPPQLVGQPQ